MPCSWPFFSRAMSFLFSVIAFQSRFSALFSQNRRSNTQKAGHAEGLADYGAPNSRENLLAETRKLSNDWLRMKFFIVGAVTRELPFDLFRDQLDEVARRLSLRIRGR